jgi:hypothetical protein
MRFGKKTMERSPCERCSLEPVEKYGSCSLEKYDSRKGGIDIGLRRQTEITKHYLLHNPVYLPGFPHAPILHLS